MALVMIVDDEAGIRMTLQAFLERAGYEAMAAANGYEILKLLDVRQPDLILADFLMPGLCGRRLLESLRDRVPNVPLIVMSGELTRESVSAALHARAVDYLCKPFTKDEMLKMVESALAHTAMATGSGSGAHESSCDRAG